MRYESIELLNYAGVYNGMSLNQITIDFSQCISNKIIFRGDNGSGKSTIMRAISPMPDSNDQFIPGVEARKTIVLIDGNTRYCIRYIHPVANSNRSTTKGYIAKSINGAMVELNTTGNISSCKEIIYDEFGFDSAYVSLAQLSSEDRGLVDKKPAERKKLINSITNSLETYNAIYKTVSKKATVLKGLIQSITSKIDSIGDAVKIGVKLQAIEQQQAQLERDKEQALEAAAALKIRITDIRKDLEEHKYKEITSELSDINHSLAAIDRSTATSLQAINVTDIDHLSEFSVYIGRLIISLESQIDSLREKIPELTVQREAEFQELQAKQNKLNSLQSDISYADIRTKYFEYKKKIEEYTRAFDEIGLRNINLITMDEFNQAMTSLQTLLDLATAITTNYSVQDIERDLNHRDEVIACVSTIPMLQDTISKMRQEYYDLCSKRTMYEAKREVAKELINRPDGCTIDSCPYIAAAIIADREYPESGYASLVERIEDLSSKLTELDKRLNDAVLAANIRRDVSFIERELESNIRFIMKLPVAPNFKETFMQRVVSLDTFQDIINLRRYVDYGNILEQFRIDKEQFAIYEREYQLYESKSMIIDSIIEDIESLQQKTNTLYSAIADVNNSIAAKQLELDEAKTSRDRVEAILSRYKESLPLKERQQELLSIKRTLDVGAEQITDLSSKLDQLNANIGGISNDIHRLSEQHERFVHALATLAEYKAELEKYSKEYTLIEKVRYYASPNTGIQSIFIGIYMNKILSTANQLLSMLFSGEFILQPFVVNESEFRIPCIGSAMIHDDISSMSTAQKAAISLIISFALLQQSSTRYNIISLDEMDGGFDTMNRSRFISLLDELMRLLNCEQAFIISHNGELDTSNCDIVQLKSNELTNGHIIWKY